MPEKDDGVVMAARFAEKFGSRKFLALMVAALLMVVSAHVGADYSRAAGLLLAYAGIEGAIDFRR